MCTAIQWCVESGEYAVLSRSLFAGRIQQRGQLAAVETLLLDQFLRNTFEFGPASGEDAFGACVQFVGDAADLLIDFLGRLFAVIPVLSSEGRPQKPCVLLASIC